MVKSIFQVRLNSIDMQEEREVEKKEGKTLWFSCYRDKMKSEEDEEPIVGFDF